MPTFVEWLLSTVSSATLLAGVVWLMKGVITTRLTSAVQHQFNEKLESIRAEHRKAEALFKADLQSKETQIQVLRSGALSALASRQAAIDQRRLIAVDQLWMALNALAPARAVANWMTVVKFDSAIKLTAKDPKARELFEAFGKVDLNSAYVDEAWKARPFVSSLAWALFSAYRAIVSLAATQLRLLQVGLDIDVVDNKKIAALVIAALPDRSAYIAEHGASALPFLLDELETKLLDEFTRMLSGVDADLASLKQAAAILQATETLNADLQKSAASVVTAPT